MEKKTEVSYCCERLLVVVLGTNSAALGFNLLAYNQFSINLSKV